MDILVLRKNMRISFNSEYSKGSYKPKFQAIPLAKYSPLSHEGADIFVYQLEKNDIDFLRNISKNIEKFYAKHDVEDESPRQIIKEAVDASIEILQRKTEEKARILITLAEGELSAILIGNILKQDKNGDFHYSSRKNHSKNETELDWLATWNKKIAGEGKVIVSEFFRRVIEDGFKQVYVRSEVPEYSYAVEFYKKMGFEPLSGRQRKFQRQNEYPYAIGNYHVLDDMIVPMKATARDMKRALKKRSYEFERSEFENHASIDLSSKL